MSAPHDKKRLIADFEEFKDHLRQSRPSARIDPSFEEKRANVRNADAGGAPSDGAPSLPLDINLSETELGHSCGREELGGIIPTRIETAADSASPRRKLYLVAAGLILGLAGLALGFNFWDADSTHPQTATSKPQADLSSREPDGVSGAGGAAKDAPIFDSSPQSATAPLSKNSNQPADPSRFQEHERDGGTVADTAARAPAEPSGVTAKPIESGSRAPSDGVPAGVTTPRQANAPALEPRAVSPASTVSPPARAQAKPKPAPLARPAGRNDQPRAQKAVKTQARENAGTAAPEQGAPQAEAPAPQPPPASITSESMSYMKRAVNSVTGTIKDLGQSAIGVVRP